MGIEKVMKNKDDSNGPNGRAFTQKKKAPILIIPMLQAG